MKVLVFAAVPGAVRCGWRGAPGNSDLTPNPIEYITHFTGDWTIRLLVVTLAVTPLRKLLRLPDLIRFRRMLGLFAFFYGRLHFLTWFGLDKFFDLHEILAGFVQAPLHHGWASPRFCADDPAGGDVHQPAGSAAWAAGAGRAAPPGLLHCHRRRWCTTTGW